MPDTPHGQILIYQDGPTALRVRLDGTSVWLTQAQIAELYQTTPQNITQHIKDIYDDNEIPESATCKEYLQVRREGNRDIQRSLKHYSLDVVLAVGYRVRSDQGRRFRQWATIQLRDLLVKGFALDDERLASGRSIGADYFEELLTRIRTIRASEGVWPESDHVAEDDELPYAFGVTVGELCLHCDGIGAQICQQREGLGGIEHVRPWWDGAGRLQSKCLHDLAVGPRYRSAYQLSLWPTMPCAQLS